MDNESRYNQAREILRGWSGSSWDAVSVEQYHSFLNLLSPSDNVRYFLENANLLSARSINKLPVDRNVYFHLKWEYGIEFSTIGCWFGVTQNTIAEKSWKNQGEWTGKEINNVERFHLQKMIREKRCEYNDGFLSIRLLNHRRKRQPLAVFIIDGNDVKLLKSNELPDSIVSSIIENDLNHILTRNPSEYNTKFYDRFADRLMAISEENEVDLSLDKKLGEDINEFFLGKVPKGHVHLNIGYFIFRATRLKLVSHDISKSDLLQQIIKIDGSMRKKKGESEQPERSVQLATKLKQFYDYHCQLCDIEGDSIPFIPHKDGKQAYYVEVHHLRPISEYKIEEEDPHLDSAWNALVVCCYHHKVLHIHSDIYETKVSYDPVKTKFYINSKSGNRLKIIRDDHFNAIQRNDW